MILDNNARDMFQNTFKIKQNTFFVIDWIVVHFFSFSRQIFSVQGKV